MFSMRTIELPWGDVARNQRHPAREGLPSMLDHADLLKQQLEQRPPDQETVTLHLTDDLFLRLHNSARWQRAIPLPREG